MAPGIFFKGRAIIWVVKMHRVPNTWPAWVSSVSMSPCSLDLCYLCRIRCTLWSTSNRLSGLHEGWRLHDHRRSSCFICCLRVREKPVDRRHYLEWAEFKSLVPAAKGQQSNVEFLEAPTLPRNVNCPLEKKRDGQNIAMLQQAARLETKHIFHNPGVLRAKILWSRLNYHFEFFASQGVQGLKEASRTPSGSILLSPAAHQWIGKYWQIFSWIWTISKFANSKRIQRSNILNITRYYEMISMAQRISHEVCDVKRQLSKALTSKWMRLQEDWMGTPPRSSLQQLGACAFEAFWLPESKLTTSACHQCCTSWEEKHSRASISQHQEWNHPWSTNQICWTPWPTSRSPHPQHIRNGCRLACHAMGKRNGGGSC